MIRSVVTALPLAFLAVGVACRFGAAGDGSFALIASSIAFAIASFAHGVRAVGLLRTGILFCLGTTLPFLLEALSVGTCMIGCYDYTAKLGPQLIGVPIVIPLGWFNTCYVAIAVTNLALDGSVAGAPSRPIRIILVSLLTAFVQAAWDLAGDPMMVHVEHAWVWHAGGRFFGIPFGNYIGWVEVAFMVNLMYRFWQTELPLPSLRPMSPWLTVVPVLMYATSGGPTMTSSEPLATRLLPPFALGFALVAAGLRSFQVQRPAVTAPMPADQGDPVHTNRPGGLPGMPSPSRQLWAVDWRSGAPIELAILVVSGVVFVGYALVQLQHIRVASYLGLSWPALASALGALSLAHAGLYLGWRHALLFLTIALTVSLGAEYVGVQTGAVFGAYHYTDVLGAKVLGVVPWIVPVTYFAILYPSYVVAAVLLVGSVEATFRRPIWLSLLIAGVSGLAMTAWDVTMDPVMSGPLGAWVWDQPGEWFGVPFHNFVGWVVTNSAIVALFLIASRALVLRPVARRDRGWPTLAIVTAWGTLWVADLFLGHPVETKLVAPFVMGIPMALAWLRAHALPSYRGISPLAPGPTR